jgi:hypothetical protein
MLQLYNEDVHDLLDTNGDVTDKARRGVIKIHETASGDIYMNGVESVQVKSAQEVCLNL